MSMFAKKSSRYFVFCFLLSILLISRPAAWSQQTLGAISGTVSDTSGALLSDASVAAVDDQTKLTRVVKTNSEGGYQLVNLPSLA